MKKLLLTTIIIAAAALHGCAPTVNARGNLVKDYQMVTITPGTSTKSDVLRAMGSPTTQDPFDENIWYYIGQTTEKKGILDPKVTDERIVMVDFDEAGLVETIKDVGGNREDIPYERRKTATSGNELTVLQQFFGNLGKFNAAGGAAAGR
jgi:outer membrane protein assembly factor BamE (lipoprotein component of BamABCDE complex)